MIFVKKLLFAPFLLAFLALLVMLISQIKPENLIFSLDLQALIQLLQICLLITLTSFSFVLFATFASDWKFLVPISLLSALVPFFFLPTPGSLFLAVGILVAQILIFVSMQGALKSYLNFNPLQLFGLPIRQLSTLLILAICLSLFISINKTVEEKGFQIPDSLIESALKLTPLPESTNTQLQQLDPTILDTLTPSKQTQTKASQNLLTDTLKQTIKEQLQTIIKPYLGIIPAVLAVLFFFILQSLTSIFNLLIYPLLWIIFYILEKSGFIKFTQEMRPVKKMVV